MGWRKAVIAANAQAKREAKEVNRHNAGIEKDLQRRLKALTQVEQEAVKNAMDYERRLASAPISAIGLRVSNGLIDSDVLEFHPIIPDVVFKFDREPWSEFSPLSKEDEDGEWRVEILDLMVAPFGTVVALRVSALNDDHKINLRLTNKSDPKASSVMMVDTENSGYVYPKDCDLSGYVMPGVPMVGCIVFEPFKRPTCSIKIHFNDLKLSEDGRKSSFSFEIKGLELAARSRKASRGVTLANDLREHIAALANEVRTHFHNEAIKAMKSRRGGCAVLALAIVPMAIVVFIVAFPAIRFLGGGG